MRQFATITKQQMIQAGHEGLPKLLEDLGIPIKYREKAEVRESYYNPATATVEHRVVKMFHPDDWRIDCAHEINTAMISEVTVITWDKEKPLGTAI